MIDPALILTNEQLSDALAQCGFATREPDLSNVWGLLKKLPPSVPVRQVAGEQYKSIYVAVVDGMLQVHDWMTMLCELQGEIPEALLAEKIELCAAPERPPSDPALCICLGLPLPHFEKVRFIGVDKANGRFGEVTLQRCRHCNRLWLHYFVEFEAYRASGRYYMGLITPEAAETITADVAADYIGSLDWHLYGGSFFDGKTGRSETKGIYVDC